MRPSLRHYIPPPSLVQIEHVQKAKATLSMQLHIKYTISISNQRLYLLNQLRKQELNVNDLTQVFMVLVVATFQYALLALAGQLSADDLHKVDVYI